MTVILKYDVDDVVFFLNKKGKIEEGKIASCHFTKKSLDSKKINYIVSGIKFPFPEENLFKTKQELAQNLLK